MDPVVPAAEREAARADRKRSVCVDSVVQGVDAAEAAVHDEGDAGLDPLAGFCAVGAGRAAAGRNADFRVLRGKNGLCLDTVLPGGDREGGIKHIDIAALRILAVIRADAVAAGRDADRRLRERHGVLAVQADVLRADAEILCRDNQIILGDDRVLIVAVDRELAGAVDGEIRLAEHRSVQRGFPVGEAVGGTVGNRVLRARRGSEKDLVRAADINRRAIGIADLRVIQHELHLVLLPRFDHDHLLFIAAGEEVHACLRDRQIAPGRERHRLGSVVFAGGVALRHIGLRRCGESGRGLCRRALRRGRGCEAAARHQQGCERTGQHDPVFACHSSSPPSVSFSRAISRLPFRQRSASRKSCAAAGFFSSIL